VFNDHHKTKQELLQIGRKIRMRVLLLALFVLGSATAVDAKEVHPEIITFNGIGFAWPKDVDVEDFKPGMAVTAFDIVAMRNNHEARVADCGRWSATYKGVNWCFSSEKNHELFAASIDPKNKDKPEYEMYLPMFGGRCALGTARGGAAIPGNPYAARTLTIEGRTGVFLQLGGQFWDEFDSDRKNYFWRAFAFMRVYRASDVIVPNEKLPAKAD
jgi:hypothetical protein